MDKYLQELKEEFKGNFIVDSGHTTEENYGELDLDECIARLAKEGRFTKDLEKDMETLEIEMENTTACSCEAECSNGWDEERLSDVLSVIEDIESATYEMRNCVRGCSTGAHTYSELSEYLKGLGRRLIEASNF